MYMEVHFVKFFCLLRVHGFYQCQGNLGGFFHHIPQLACDLHLSGSPDKRSLHKQDFPSGSGPGQACHNSRHSLLENALMMHGVSSQEFRNTLFTDCDALLLALD